MTEKKGEEEAKRKKRRKKEKQVNEKTDSYGETGMARREKRVEGGKWRRKEQLDGAKEERRGSKRQKLQQPSVKRKETRRAPAQETHRWAWRLSLRGAPGRHDMKLYTLAKGIFVFVPFPFLFPPSRFVVRPSSSLRPHLLAVVSRLQSQSQARVRPRAQYE